MTDHQKMTASSASVCVALPVPVVLTEAEKRNDYPQNVSIANYTAEFIMRKSLENIEKNTTKIYVCWQRKIHAMAS